MSRTGRTFFELVLIAIIYRPLLSTEGFLISERIHCNASARPSPVRAVRMYWLESQDERVGWTVGTLRCSHRTTITGIDVHEASSLPSLLFSTKQLELGVRKPWE
jgi:hypothetical protein